jgi:hypothetical protein
MSLKNQNNLQTGYTYIENWNLFTWELGIFVVSVLEYVTFIESNSEWEVTWNEAVIVLLKHLSRNIPTESKIS